jgi:hypothetical protein
MDQMSDRLKVASVQVIVQLLWVVGTNRLSLGVKLELKMVFLSLSK